MGVSVGVEGRGVEGGRVGVEGVRGCRGGGGAARLGHRWGSGRSRRDG